MAGIAGALAFDPVWNVARFVYYSLLSLQHRGQEEACLYVADGEKIEWVCGKGFVDEVLPPATNLAGWAAIGGVWSEHPGYRAYSEEPAEAAVVLDGRLFNATPYDVAKKLSELKASGYEGEDLLKELVKDLKGAFSMLALTASGELLAYRSPPGLRPLQLGGLGFDMVTFASESCAFDVIGADLKKDLDPGTGFYASQLYFNEVSVKPSEKVVCAFEYIYNARPDSVIDGVEVYEVRERIGKRLAQLYPRDVDVVVGVPETAIPFAIGYSKEAKKDYRLGFIATGRKARTAIKPDLSERLIGVQLKLNPIRSTFRKKRALIIDDSVVRGLTLKTVIQTLKSKVGAVSVDVLIGSPKIISHCPYGVEVPPADQLIAAKMDNEKIAEYIGAKSIEWLPPEELEKLIPIKACMGCFTGRYPLREERS
ncbi:amidophosphoribosyltransferase [Ignicoccus hospitalis]|uniref:Amidophosphoribosyltransferase n=1 Tax=Ignicoccus hospitalis (strain KIN4/I / DSM 18386 / JCM 14125) TaxID=453591 RepID=A8AA30_IGNH4|nr:amidophosphoribosyltransferase [Ignicoccus hospitalis]ABU81782.1 amidophosphoribosyltransferase [Ignicoccus hospitalis KIN4/I]HIH90050.1 amidophosphoribosyltransferase [Desulfurococcaceae archaeon]